MRVRLGYGADLVACGVDTYQGEVEDYSINISGAIPTISVNIASNDVTCGGDNDGSATATAAGGTAPYTYAWSNGNSSATNNSLYAVSYTVTATDANGYTGTNSVTISEPSVLVAKLVPTNASSIGATDGSIDLTVSGGVPPYTFAWSNGASTEDLNSLGAGTYTVTIQDANGCSRIQSTTISDGGTPVYCDAITLLDYNWITNVTVAGINNSSTWEGGYSDYTSIAGTMTMGMSYSLSLGFEVDYWPDIAAAVWIDWNIDGDFDDAGEEVYVKRGTAPFSSSINVPAYATPGSTRMRVRMGYGTDLTACGTDSYQGEVEDYTLTVNASSIALNLRTFLEGPYLSCLLYTSPSPRDLSTSRMPSSA